MAWNKKTFQTRAITAVVFAAVMLLGLFTGEFFFFLLFSLIHFGCWWEFLSLVEKIHKTVFHIYIRLGLMVMGYGIMTWFTDLQLFQVSIKNDLSLPITAAGFAILLMGIFQQKQINLKSIFGALAGLIYISFSWACMLDLYLVFTTIHTATSFHFPVWLVGILPPVIIFTIWINDTMAYIVGSLIGKTPLSPISPKKTWEGTVGGIILAVAVSSLVIILAMHFARGTDWYHWVAITAIAAIVGTLGDLFESKLKRMAGVKDSGSFMPGHGGFLDRFDSLLLATPFAWLYVQLFF
jgi:phosphatidate cytidylyltransferase